MNPVIDLALPAILAFIMFSLGLTLVADDFRRVVARPRAVLVGLVCQMVVLPLAAFNIASVGGLAPGMAVGLMILAACPGGVTSSLLTHLARGDTALSVSLTAITSVAAVFSVPFVVEMSLRHFTGAGAGIDLPVESMVRGVFLITTLPVVAGMLLRRYRSSLADRLEGATGKTSIVLFLLVVIATFVSQRNTFTDHFLTVGPAAAALVVTVMAGGYAAGRLTRLGRRSAIAVAVESGMQNAALGIFVAATLLRAPHLAVPSVIYALLMNVGALAFVLLLRRREPAAVA